MRALQFAPSLAVAIAASSVSAAAAAPGEDFTVAQFEDAVAGHHSDRVAGLLAPHVTLGGLRFEADDCARFDRPQPLADKDREAFVLCLEGLAPSGFTTHHGAKAQAGAFLVRGGVAIGAGVANRQIVSLGFVDTDAKDAAIPTVFRAADQVAAHIAIPDELRQTIDRREDHRAVAVVKACVDAKGKVTRTRIVEGSGTGPYDVLARWTVEHYAFAAVQLGGAPAAACEVIRFELDTRPNATPPETSRPVTVAAATLEPLRTKGTPAAKLGPEPAQRAALAKQFPDGLRGTWKVCLDAGGRYASTAKLQASRSAAFDTQIEAAFAQWAFEPLPDHKPACAIVIVAWRP